MTISTMTLIPIITIFIHGTRPTELVLPLFQRFISGIENVLCVDKQNPGLLPCKKINNREYLTELAHVYCLHRNISIDDFYFYAWSGKLNPQARKEAAIQLAHELIILTNEYEKKYGIKPIIEIITHSHGGNVALLMGEYVHMIHPTFNINKLMLLACPVQKATKELVQLPIFEKIYNIHSHNDWLQVLDPQGIHKLIHEESPSESKLTSEFFGSFNNFSLFSERHFAAMKKNIIEVNVKWGKTTKPQDPKKNLFPKWLRQRINFANTLSIERGLFHIEFTLLPFIAMLVSLIIDIDKRMEKSEHQTFPHDVTIIL